MVLMLQSANRQTKETLKLFRDRGDVHGFIPPEGEQDAQRELLNQISNLDSYDKVGVFSHIKDSLGNALRIIKPVVVMDEGHRAISELAFETLYDFNPSFVLELSATPKDLESKGGKNPREARSANILVEVTGLELDAEGMIKMPLILDHKGVDDWQTTLNAAVNKLDELQRQATKYQANSNKYIRPILLVQVERTGKDQRDGSHIHAEDVKDWLIKRGLKEEEIAIKTAEQNDLSQPENQDLLSTKSQIRVIITKEALKEGWDCSFAYILCTLAVQSKLSAMTQLVGRILRQPQTEKTGIEALDQCYVFTHLTETRTLITQIKNALIGEGLGDLVVRVTETEDSIIPYGSRKIHRRKTFKDKEIYYPKVMVKRDGNLVSINYETDVLSKTNWRKFDPNVIAKNIDLSNRPVENQLYRLSLSRNIDTLIDDKLTKTVENSAQFDPVQAVQQISDLVLNPFVGMEIVNSLINLIRAKKVNEQVLGFQAPRIIELLRNDLQIYQDKVAEEYFKKEVASGNIQFRLRADRNNWTMPKTLEVSDTTVSIPGLQRSLFEDVSNNELNESEKKVAFYIDQQETLNWWHRNVARKHYGLQGWKKNVIYPDFLFSVKDSGKKPNLVALETKGEFLDGTEDTEYKRDLLQFLTNNFDWDNTVPVGELELESEGQTVICDLVLLKDWEGELKKFFP